MSLSVLKVDDQILDGLDAHTAAPAWPVGVAGTLQKPASKQSTPWCYKMWSWAAHRYEMFFLGQKAS